MMFASAHLRRAICRTLLTPAKLCASKGKKWLTAAAPEALFRDAAAAGGVEQVHMARRDLEAQRLAGLVRRTAIGARDQHRAARHLAVEQRVRTEILDQLDRERERPVGAGDE